MCVGNDWLSAAMILQKVEIRFEKSEAIRFISHHDLMRALMRAVRRSALPVRLTEGFNPRPRLIFPVALEVGVASLDEVAEIELTQCLNIQEFQARLSSALPPGLTVKSARELPPRRASRAVERMTYRVHLAEAGVTLDPALLPELLAKTALPFGRQREKSIQNVDLRPALLALDIVDGDLLAAVKPTSQGTARPLEVLSLLLQTPLEKLKHIRATKITMEMEPDRPLSEMELTERGLLMKKYEKSGIRSGGWTPETTSEPDPEPEA
jgi:radical SAM-linked protein